MSAVLEIAQERQLRGACRRVSVDSSYATPLLRLQGGEQDRYARLRLRDGTWIVAYPKDPFARADS